MGTKIVLFATSNLDAKNYCEINGLNFDDVVWVLNYQLLGETGLKDASEIHHTELFKQMPAYNEALAGEIKDKETL